MKKILSPECFEKRYKARLAHLKRDLKVYDDDTMILVEDIMLALYTHMQEYEDPNIENAVLNLGQSLHWVQCFIYED